VRSASLAAITPLGGSRWNGNFFVEGYEFKPNDKKYVDMNSVGPRFFETVGIPLLMGREFREEDSPATSEAPPPTLVFGPQPVRPGPRVTIVNESFAQQILHDPHPVGRLVGSGKTAMRIVGVSNDVQTKPGLDATSPIEILNKWRHR